MIKRKFYLEKIVKLIDTEDIKVITGVRRCGKTVLLKQIIDELENRGIASENIIYMSFESSKYKNIRNDDDLDEFIECTQNDYKLEYLITFIKDEKTKELLEKELEKDKLYINKNPFKNESFKIDIV